jgi:acyl-CoA thioester hydrolase
MSAAPKATSLNRERMDRFPAVIREMVRFSDTDRQGHVKNVMFSVFFEAGRAEILFCSGLRLNPPGTEFVLVQSNIELIGQLHWPGEVVIGSRVVKIGRSSVALRHALFQKEICAAVSDAVMVLMRTTIGESTPISPRARAFFATLQC